MDEALVEDWRRRLTGCSREQLADWRRFAARVPDNPELIEACTRLLEERGGPPSPEALRAYRVGWGRKVLVGRSREELAFLAIWGEDGLPLEAEFEEARRSLLEERGGQPSVEAMRMWLEAKFAKRDKKTKGTEERAGPHLRHQSCPNCQTSTTQTLHGYTVTGGLWKGHACRCAGWECRGCGGILERAGSCCR